MIGIYLSFGFKYLCECVWMQGFVVCGLIHITHNVPPLSCWANTTSPRDTIKSPSPKSGLSGWVVRCGRLTEQFLSPPRLHWPPWQDAEGPKMSACSKSPICFNTVGWLQNLKKSQHVTSLLALHWAMHAHTVGNRKAWSAQQFMGVQVVCVCRGAGLMGCDQSFSLVWAFLGKYRENMLFLSKTELGRIFNSLKLTTHACSYWRFVEKNPYV